MVVKSENVELALMIANRATIECADIDFNWIRVLQEMLNIKEAAALTHSHSLAIRRQQHQDKV